MTVRDSKTLLDRAATVTEREDSATYAKIAP